MKTKLIIAIVLMALFASCAKIPRYLPRLENMGSSPNGAFVTLDQRGDITIYGELIAADSASVYVLTDSDYHNFSRCIKVPKERIADFKLRYAAPASYGWSMPAFGLLVAPVTSGLLSIVTIPLNLIVTGSVVAGSYQATKYTAVDIRKDDFWKFARYPQGLPPGTDLASIK